jgi:paraquat-inducible protein A
MVIGEHDQYVVGILFLFLIVIFPITILLSLFVLLFFMKIKKAGYFTTRLLILIAHVAPWSMVDIFFVSLLVSMVKLFDVANIELGIAFFALFFTLFLDLIITKHINFHQLWEKHREIYGAVNG